MFDYQHADLCSTQPVGNLGRSPSRNLIDRFGMRNASLNCCVHAGTYLDATADASWDRPIITASGGAAGYLRPEHPLTKDYAIVAVLPGVEPEHQDVVFSGERR